MTRNLSRFSVGDYTHTHANPRYTRLMQAGKKAPLVPTLEKQGYLFVRIRGRSGGMRWKRCVATPTWSENTALGVGLVLQ